MMRCLSALAVALACLTAGRAETLAPATASAFIESLSGRLVAVIDGDGSDTAKGAQLQAIVDRAVDVAEIAKFTLGRYWQTASPSQQQSFVDLFHQVLLDGVAGQIRNYKGVTITVGHVQAREQDVVVTSVVRRPDKGPAKVDWVVVQAAGGPKVEDVIAEGTSLRLTRRNDYSAFLTKRGGDIDVLLSAIRQRLSQQ